MTCACSRSTAQSPAIIAGLYSFHCWKDRNHAACYSLALNGDRAIGLGRPHYLGCRFVWTAGPLLPIWLFKLSYLLNLRAGILIMIL